MASGSAEMRKQIKRLRKLGGLVEQSAPLIAVAVKEENRKQISKGQSPDGTPWPKTKKGEQPLVDAAAHVTVAAIGSTVLMSVSDHHARHHFGFVRGKIKRQILPTDEIPQPMTRAITGVVTGEFSAIMETTLSDK